MTKDPGKAPTSSRNSRGKNHITGWKGDARGSRVYCQAPEQVVHKDTGDWVLHGDKCDVYAVGMISFFLLSGKWPSTGGAIDVKALPQGLSPPSLSFIKTSAAPAPQDRTSSLELRDHAWMDLASKAYKESLAKQSSTSKGPGSALNTPLLNADSMLKGFQQMASMNDFERACITALAHHLPEDKTTHLRKVFAKLDTNGDGRLSAEELQKGLADVLKSGKKGAEQFERLLASLDTDGSGEIEYTEFIAATFAMNTNLKDEICEAAFRVFDRDASGFISIAEVRAVLDGPGLDVKGMEDFLRRADDNGDGQVDMHEFKTLLFAGKGNAEKAAQLSAHSMVHSFRAEQSARVSVRQSVRASVTSGDSEACSEMSGAMSLAKDGPSKWTMAEDEMILSLTGPDSAEAIAAASGRLAEASGRSKATSKGTSSKAGLFRQLTGQMLGLNSPENSPQQSPRKDGKVPGRSEGFASRLKRAITGQKLDEIEDADAGKPKAKAKVKGKAKGKAKAKPESTMARLKRAISFATVEDKAEEQEEDEEEDKEKNVKPKHVHMAPEKPKLQSAVSAVLKIADDGVYAKTAEADKSKVAKEIKKWEKEDKEKRKRELQEQKVAWLKAKAAEANGDVEDDPTEAFHPSALARLAKEAEEDYDDEIGKERPFCRIHTEHEKAYDAHRESQAKEEEANKRAQAAEAKESKGPLTMKHVQTNVSIQTVMAPKPKERKKFAPIEFTEHGQAQEATDKKPTTGEQRVLKTGAAVAALAPVKQGAHDAPVDGTACLLLDRGTNHGREARRQQGEKRVMEASAALAAAAMSSPKGANFSDHASPSPQSTSPRSPKGTRVATGRDAARMRLQGRSSAVHALLPAVQAALLDTHHDVAHHEVDIDRTSYGDNSPPTNSPPNTSPRSTSPRNLGMLAKGGSRRAHRRRSVEGQAELPQYAPVM